MNKKQWPCLVSDPDVFNAFVRRLRAAGVLRSDKEREFVDVISLDPADLFCEPEAFVVLIDLTSSIERRYADLAAAGPEHLPRFERDAETLTALGVRLIKQRIVNACAVFAIAHCFANLPGCGIEGINGWDPEGNRAAFESQEALAEALTATVSEFSLSASCEDDVSTHFVAFVALGGGLWELDGRQEFPIYHGALTGGAESWPEAALTAVKKITLYDPENSKYNIMALQRV